MTVVCRAPSRRGHKFIWPCSGRARPAKELTLETKIGAEIIFLILIALFNSAVSFPVDSAISEACIKEAAQTRQAENTRQTFCDEKAGKKKY